MSHKPVIVVSATRFFQGGTLVIVAECLKFLSEHYSTTHTIKALVYKRVLYEQVDPQLKDLEGIEWLEFPGARKSVIHRINHEYIIFGKLSRQLQPVLWLSLQDSTPKVEAKVRAVYFHNPLLDIPRGLIFKFWKHQRRLAVLRFLYKYIYTKGIKNNDFVITQQEGIAALLEQNYKVKGSKIRVFPPTSFLFNQLREECSNDERILPDMIKEDGSGRPDEPYTFIFPATAFYYKNHALIIKACRLLNDIISAINKKERISLPYEVILTIDGSENAHVHKLVLKARYEFPQIRFVGFVRREALYKHYKKADCMIFPSLLESWGLPLSEFAAYNKPILCSDLSYGHSTLRDYKKAVFFDPSQEKQLADLMLLAIRGELRFNTPVNVTNPDYLFLNSWEELFDQLLPANA